MKRIYTSLLGILFAAICMANTDLTPGQMTGRSTKGLYGKVKTAVYSTGETITFNREGNIIKVQEEKYTTTYSYITPTRYVADNNSYFTYNIVFTDNMRKEVMDNPEKLSDDYTFDNQGRISKALFGGYSGHNETYFYNGSEKHPAKTVIELYDEMGRTTITYAYQYLNIDVHGNWTKRKVNGTRKDVEYEDGKPEKVTTESKSFIETCTLTYFEDSSVPGKTPPSIEITAPETTGVNGQFKLIFSLQSKPQNVKLNSSGNFEVLMGPATSTSTTVKAGTTITKFGFTYILTPKRKGKLPLPSLTAQVNGQNVTSKPSYINVTDNGAVNSGKPTTTKKDSIFVKIILDKETVRKGESVLCSLKIYTLNDISSVDEVSLIDFPYCYIEEQELESSQNYTLENIRNVTYKTLIFRKFKLTPLQIGQIRIPSINFCFTSKETVASEDPFDSFFNGSLSKEIKHSVSTSPITLNVTQ
ncbi:BatD family protein [uncultured Bacteroides sp.]|uniref:BatD family protein n=1 Tax=uncultured Bacteroides sp. TaxID=162156 RepID=UPI0025E95F25|nr:BatD family protein [uncultured Bacteroides sp.]